MHGKKTTQTEVVAVLLEGNEKRFTQAKTTPITVSPLKEDFGLLGTGPKSKLLLEGTYVPPSSVDNITASIFQQMAVVDTPSPITQPTPVTSDELQSGRDKVKERTSSSPSKMHVGHWKLLAGIHQYIGLTKLC